MSLSIAQATDLMLTRFKAAWDADATAIAGYEPFVFWPSVAVSSVPAGKIVAKVYLGISENKQRSIGRPAYWRYKGSLFVIVLAPITQRDGADVSQRLAEVVKNAFQGQSEPGGLWYREVILRDVPSEGGWFQYRAEVRFEGDELK